MLLTFYKVWFTKVVIFYKLQLIKQENLLFIWFI